MLDYHSHLESQFEGIAPEDLERVYKELLADEEERQTRDAWNVLFKPHTDWYQSSKRDIEKRLTPPKGGRLPPPPAEIFHSPITPGPFGRAAFLVDAIRRLIPNGRKSLTYEDTILQCSEVRNLMKDNPDWLDDKVVLNYLRVAHLNSRARYIVELLYKDYFKLASAKNLISTIDDMTENMVRCNQRTPTNDQVALTTDILKNRSDLAPQILGKLNACQKKYPHNKAIKELVKAAYITIIGETASSPKPPKRFTLPNMFRALGFCRFPDARPR